MGSGKGAEAGRAVPAPLYQRFTGTRRRRMGQEIYLPWRRDSEPERNRKSHAGLQFLHAGYRKSAPPLQ